MIADYCDETIYVSPRESIDSDGNPTWGAEVEMQARVQLTTFTVSDGQGNGIRIDAVVYTDHTSPLDLGSRVRTDDDSYLIERRRIYKQFGVVSHQSFLLSRMP